MNYDFSNIIIHWPWDLNRIPLITMLLGVVSVLVKASIEKFQNNENKSQFILLMTFFISIFALPQGVFYINCTFDVLVLYRIILDFICLMFFSWFETMTSNLSDSTLKKIFSSLVEYSLLYGIVFYFGCFVLLFFNAIEFSLYPEIIIFIVGGMLMTACIQNIRTHKTENAKNGTNYR